MDHALHAVSEASVPSENMDMADIRTISRKRQLPGYLPTHKAQRNRTGAR